MNFSTYKEIPKMTDEEILAKTPKYWKQKINEYNIMVDNMIYNHRYYDEVLKRISKLESKIFEKDNEIEKLNNVIKNYDLPVQELIVEYHPYCKKCGYHDKKDINTNGRTYSMDFVSDEIAVQRIVTKSWKVETMEERDWYLEATLYLTDADNCVTKCITTSKGPEFSWIELDGEEKFFPYGAIISVKDRNGKELYHISKDDEVVIGKDQYVWEQE